MVEEIRGKGKEQPQNWEYDSHFREYVLLLGRKGKDWLESIDNFPGSIGLEQSWHNPLERMRSETKKDGHERYALIGSKEHREFYFPEVFAKGTQDNVPVAVWKIEMAQALEKYQLSGISGELHSHPDNSPFTPPDLYRVLNDFREPPIFMAGLATTEENIFAFRTKETFTVTPLDMWPQSFPKHFEDYWIEHAGYKFSPDHSRLIKVASSPDPWKASLGIAETHRLALYRGKPRADLKRVYP
jgi:hypothetical protein